MIKGPELYDPIGAPAWRWQRRNVVLEDMLQYGMITSASTTRRPSSLPSSSPMRSAGVLQEPLWVNYVTGRVPERPALRTSLRSTGRTCCSAAG